MTAAIRLYEQLLLRNLSAVQSIESGIRNVTWLLPVTTLLSVVSGYHDTLITKRLDPSLSLPPHPFLRSRRKSAYPDHPEIPPRTQPVLPPTSDHNRYTRYWTARSGVYRKAARVLTTLGYVQLLLEMLAKRRGERVRWRLVLVIESIKTLLRLVILRLTGRPVLSHPTPHRDLDISTLPTEILDPPSLDPSDPASEHTPLGTSQAILPLLPPGPALRTHLYPLASSLPEEYLPHPLTVLPEIETAGGYISEVLSSSATLVQVLLLLRAAHQPNSASYRPLSLPTLSRSLPPFLIPLLMRLLARHLREASTSPLQAQHHASQDKRLLVHAFLTGPMWIGYTRPKIQGWVEWFGRWPLIGMVAGLGEGYLPLVDDYVYYTSS
ncbi:peroxisome membrane protein [Dioszegia hungarica]|uniref:Peroxisomal membrane protein PEX16 n=1 Tax=Dioszegia hungarica TaxID=4972 RepID=A0AA38HBX9_9TREE|nr:peroxisome membrane protein [Dioszegia hungarica]KAI9637312.1 peroxisome membrane protein [Dioszegia hungarica]